MSQSSCCQEDGDACGPFIDQEREIKRLRELLKLIDKRDAEWNLFNCPSGGWIRQELKQILCETSG